jgi:hypothetical protein
MSVGDACIRNCNKPPAVIKVVVRVHKLWLSKKLHNNSQNFEFFSGSLGIHLVNVHIQT